jgi:diguanylate cyclase (GGDEF)-like protein
MQITGMLLGNFPTICLSIGLGIIIITNKRFDKKTNTSFGIFVLIILGLVAASIADLVCSLDPVPSVLRYIASAAGYVLRPASIAILISILLRRKKTGYVLWIPIVLTAVIAFTSPFTHLMFWFSSENYFMRGPLGYISHIESFIYIFILVFLTIKKQKYIASSEVFTVLFSSFICIIAALLETKLSDYHFLITGAMAVSCALYYIVLYAETFNVDELTGLLNRKTLYLNVNSSKNKEYSIISADLNNLKDINDSKGHSAGDGALKYLADTLIANSGKNFCPYRTGGDEFIILGKELNIEETELFIKNVKTDLEKEGYMASFGYALYHTGDNFDAICIQADEKMYADKKRYKHRTVSRESGTEALSRPLS